MAKQRSFPGNEAGEPKEFVVMREYYHIIILIDSSGSMLFPFLENIDNWNEESSSDYKNAVRKTQDAMTEAHKKALEALRNSKLCNDGVLLMHQYTFNSSKHRLNEAEELSSADVDDVVKLTSSNYIPYNGTALYNTIHEALSVVYKKHLVKALNEEARPDKVIVGVITDGMDTVIKDNEFMKNKKINEIKELLKDLRGNDQYSHLVSSVLIGLTSSDFTKKTLDEVKNELTFDEAISINQSDDKAIRRAFKLFSTDAASV